MSLPIPKLLAQFASLRLPESHLEATTGAREEATAWLLDALQSAVTLELATLPPYLTALWSIKEEMHPAAVSIREIVQEEMQHMGMVCNMLKAIGGTPQIAGRVPTYPAHGLPGGVMPDLVVEIDGLSQSSLHTFMTIEQPDVDAITGARPPEAAPGTYATIGDFYDAIKRGFKALGPEFPIDGQVCGPRTGWAINDLKAVDRAIETIKEQGEGSSGSPEDFGVTDFAHYYRFAEIRNGKRIRKVPGQDKKWEYGPEAMPFPDVWPVAKLPAGGYDLDRVSGKIIHLLDEFDDAYTRLLDALQATWSGTGQTTFWRSIEAMFEMQEHALTLMQTPRYDHDGKVNYVPRWQYGRGRR